jgi:hypothetical protein
MSDLRNQTPSTTYKGLLQVNDYSNGVDATSKFVQDGEGTNSALSISTTKVGVGTSSPSAPLDVTSTTGGVIFPRLNTAQRDLISSPTNGETIYNTTTTQVESYNGTDWVAGGTTVVATNAVTSDSITNDAIIEAKIADNAVTPAKLDDTQTYTVNGLSSTSNIAITRASEGPGLRLTYDAATDEVRDIFVDSNGAFQFTNVSGGGTQGTLMTLQDDGTLSVYGTEAAAYVDSNLENQSGTGLGGRMRIIQGSNVASLQYQESGERATLNIVDGSLSANAGITVACSSASQASVQPTGSMYSNPNSHVDLGSSANTWDNGWINSPWTSSDRNLKQDIEDLSEEELRVATALKGLMKKFRLKDAVAKKGDDARIHIGVIAQDVKAAFEAEGLDAYRYAIIGEDTWWSKQDEDGEWIIKNDNPNDATYTEYTKMSVRYEQLLAFIIAAM